MRTEKELWEVVLSRPDLFKSGLCGWVHNLWVEKTITKLERITLDLVLRKNLPYKTFSSFYCWTKGQIQPRIDWINNRIKEL